LVRHVTPPNTRPTVLLVDDEPGVRTVARLTLSANGYTVLEAADGPEAVRVSEAHPGPIHLLLTDVNLVGMNGREVALAIRARHPGAKVLLTSGEPDGGSDQLPASAFLLKPFTLAGLSAKVREMLST
jgi:two-component system cell cycle sensor histidine kinase/response regulator CckA